MTTHTIALARHTAQVVGLAGVLVLGTRDSYGTEQLLLRHGPEWEGLAIDATFHNTPNDKGVTMLVDADGLVPVPPEACTQPSTYATITFRGVQDGVQRISCNLPYMVLDHAQVPGANSTATPSENAQVLAQMQDLRDGAVDAKNQAEAARDDAAKSAVASKESETNASQSATAAANSATAAAGSATAAAGDAKTASDAAAGAADAKAAAVAAQKDAAASKAAAANSSAAAKTSEDAAAKSAADADSTANSIKESMTQIAALQKRQNVLVGSETGNPASCDDAFAAPLCGLTVYGKSTQDGTPTPDAPVPIVSAGDGGSVAVKVTGKNRMPSNLKYRDFAECFVKKNTLITFVFKGGFVSQGGNILFIGENNENLWFGIDAGKAEHHITLKANATKFQYLLNNTASENVCLTWNASSPDYEPYREQLLTLPTHNGLPGIPVTSGGNYTDQNGQQWVCDEVDLERGVKVQRVDKAAFDSTKTLAEQNAILATPIETPLTPAEIAAYKVITAYAPDTVVQASDGAGVKLEYQRDVNIVIKKFEDAIASMTTT